MIKKIEFIKNASLHQKSGHKWIASQHGRLRGHFALRVVQKLLEKLDIFCTSLRSVMKLRPEWSCLVKQLKKKNMTDCESWVFHHRFDNLNNLFSWIFGEINNLWSLVVPAIFFPFFASSESLDHLFNYKEHFQEACVCACVQAWVCFSMCFLAH